MNFNHKLLFNLRYHKPSSFDGLKQFLLGGNYTNELNTNKIRVSIYEIDRQYCFETNNIIANLNQSSYKITDISWFGIYKDTILNNIQKL